MANTANRTEVGTFVNLKAALPELEKLLQQASGDWEYEDPIWRQSRI